MSWLHALFRKQRKLIAVFIDETGYEIRFKTAYQNNKFVVKRLGKEPQTYIVDNNFTLRDWKTKLPVAHYYVNNPNPIRYAHERNAEVDAIGFTKILDSKTIQDLFSEEGAKKLILLMVLIGINLVVTLIILLVEFGAIKVGKAAAGGGA